MELGQSQFYICFCRDIEESSTYVTWIDNYNAKWRMKQQNIQKDGLQLANWTGIAVREYRGADIDMTVRRDDKNCIVPALPNDLFKHIPGVINFVKNLSQHILQLHGERKHPFENLTGMSNFPFLFDTSFMVKWGVDRVPLKPNPRSPRLPPEYKKAIEESPDTLTNFYPKAILPTNIGSNVGIVKILKDFYTDVVKRQKKQQVERYYIITCDENIYKRAMRVPIPYVIPFSSRSTQKRLYNIYFFRLRTRKVQDLQLSVNTSTLLLDIGTP